MCACVYVFAAVVALGILVVLPALPVRSLLTDLPAHFPLQYFVSAIVLLGLAFYTRTPAMAVVMLGLIMGICFVRMLPFLPGGDSQIVSGAQTLKILQANVLVVNTDTAKLRDLIEREQPDIIVLEEVNTPFSSMLSDIRCAYPHQDIVVQDNGSFGIAVASKLPFKNLERQNFARPDITAQIIDLDAAGKPLQIVSLHAANPLKDLPARDRELDILAQWMKGHPARNRIVTGDFNATPYTPIMKTFMSATGLVNARTRRGLYGSYPAFLPALARIPIDHLLHTRDIKITNFRLGPNIGSDHLPTVTVLAFD